MVWMGMMMGGGALLALSVRGERAGGDRVVEARWLNGAGPARRRGQSVPQGCRVGGWAVLCDGPLCIAVLTESVRERDEATGAGRG